MKFERLLDLPIGYKLMLAISLVAGMAVLMGLLAIDSLAALQANPAMANELFGNAWRLLTGLMVGAILIAILVVWLMQGLFLQPLQRQIAVLNDLASGKAILVVPDQDRGDEIGHMARSLSGLLQIVQSQEHTSWVKGCTAQIVAAVQKHDSMPNFARQLMVTLTPLLGAQVGVFYYYDAARECYALLGSYGYKERKGLKLNFRTGEGIVGQCAAERAPITLSSVPDDYIHVSSGLGEAPPRCVMAIPVASANGAIPAVIEVATLTSFSEREHALLDEVLPMIALNIDILERNQRTQEPLTGCA